MMLVFYYVLLNIAAFILYGLDKWKARRDKWRIPEKMLLLTAFLGGGCGAFLGMQIFRHKTRHVLFILLVPLSIVLHIIFCLVLYSYF